MKKIQIILFTLAISLGAVIGLALAARGQDAKVIALNAEDARQAKFLQEQVDIATKRLRDFNEEIRHKYTQTMTMECPGSWTFGSGEGYITINPNGNLVTEHKDTPPPPPCKKTEKNYHDKDGWSLGFKYSEDYKYIVPSILPASSPYHQNSCSWMTPAVMY